MQYIASLDMNNLGASFYNKREMETFDFLKSGSKLRNKHKSLVNLVKVDFESVEEAKKVLRLWKKTDQIYFADPNYESKLDDAIYDRVSSEFLENETTAPWLDQIDFVEAIEVVSNKLNGTPIVAVLDSGLDIEHPDFANNLYKNTANTNTICKNDTDGCDTTKGDKEYLGVGEVYPASTSAYSQTRYGQCAHGTHVAGLIAAQPADEKGYYGVCPYCLIFPVKIVENDGDDFGIPDSAIISAFSYVSGFKQGEDPGIRIVNASFGKFDRSRSVELFINALEVLVREL